MIINSCITYSQINSGTIIYGQKIKEQKREVDENVNSAFSKMHEAQMNQIRENSTRINYVLKFNNHETEFQVEKTMDLENSDGNVEDAIFHVDGDGQRYFSSKDNIGFWAHNAFDKDVVLIDSVNPGNWVITQESKRIGQYETYKATHEKLLDNGKKTIVTAWFAPSITNSFGPIGYYGLPGLILELHERDFILFAKEINLGAKEISINSKLKGQKMTQSEYDKFTAKAVEKSFFKLN